MGWLPGAAGALCVFICMQWRSLARVHRHGLHEAAFQSPLSLTLGNGSALSIREPIVIACYNITQEWVLFLEAQEVYEEQNGYVTGCFALSGLRISRFVAVIDHELTNVSSDPDFSCYPNVFLLVNNNSKLIVFPSNTSLVFLLVLSNTLLKMKNPITVIFEDNKLYSLYLITLSAIEKQLSFTEHVLINLIHFNYRGNIYSWR